MLYNKDEHLCFVRVAGMLFTDRYTYFSVSATLDFDKLVDLRKDLGGNQTGAERRKSTLAVEENNTFTMITYEK